MSKIQKRPYKKAFKAQNQMVLYKRPKYVSLTNPPNKPMKPEKKNVDNLNVTVNSVGLTWTGGQPLNLLATGAGANQRVGRTITMKSLQIRVVGPTSTIRVLVVYDTQPNGSGPATNDVITSVSDFNAYPNLSNDKRFIVLVDEIHHDMYSVDLPAASIYRKINLDTHFNTGTTGVIADITTGSMLLFVGTVAVIAPAVPQYTYSSRIRYTDV